MPPDFCLLHEQAVGAQIFSCSHGFATPFALRFTYTDMSSFKTEAKKMYLFDWCNDGKDVDDLIYGDDRTISQR